MNRCYPLTLALFVPFILIGCDIFESSNGELTPATVCIYNAVESGATEDFGKPCTQDSECQFGVCMMPGDLGNLSNEVFGFCTRGCDCGCVADGSDCPQSVSGSDPLWSCAYPGGCFPGQSQGGWRHVLRKCSSVDDCKAIDSRYTDCTGTFQSSGCGKEDRVCMAFAPE